MIVETTSNIISFTDIESIDDIIFILRTAENKYKIKIFVPKVNENNASNTWVFEENTKYYITNIYENNKVIGACIHAYINNKVSSININFEDDNVIQLIRIINN